MPWKYDQSYLGRDKLGERLLLRQILSHRRGFEVQFPYRQSVLHKRWNKKKCRVLPLGHSRTFP